MITEITMSGLRGVQDGLLADLGPLVVLVGPNGCGKSTVLDALLIGASNHPADAIGRSVRRRANSWNGSRWLFSRQLEERTASIGVRRRQGERLVERSTTLTWREEPHDRLVDELSGQRRPEPYSAIFAETQIGGDRYAAEVAFAADNAYAYLSRADAPIRGWEMRLIDSPQGANQPLDAVYTQAVEKGRKRLADEALRATLGDGVVGLTLLTDHRIPVVHIEYTDGSVPVSVAGEGVASLVRIALELASRPGGALLLEEPEVHQHPRIIWQTAELIWASVAREVQIFLSTHSLDLIDALIAKAPAEGLDQLAIHRLKLEGGQLISSRIAGEDAAERRADFEDDLR